MVLKLAAFQKLPRLQKVLADCGYAGEYLSFIQIKFDYGYITTRTIFNRARYICKSIFISPSKLVASNLARFRLCVTLSCVLLQNLFCLLLLINRSVIRSTRLPASGVLIGLFYSDGTLVASFVPRRTLDIYILLP
ncbi:MAG: hypothetical protein LBU65_12365 [Planctomycetaceae bacterium]|nr:hypothetical protein [Planctomycetaceae bacterium]